MNYKLEIALDYLAHGLSIIPLITASKTPIVSRWQPFMTARPTVGQVRDWFNRWPTANIGIITGTVSGVIALDIDGPDGERFVELKGGIPSTPTSRTGRGRHVFFACPDYCVRNFVHRLPELDMRGEGGYVVAYPSLHPSGRQYVWEIGLETPFAPVPGWLHEIIKPRLRNPEQAFEYTPQREIRYRTAYGRMALLSEARELAATRVERNNRLYRAALKMGSLIADGKVDREAVESMLYEAAQDCGLVTEDGEAQTRATIASGINKGLESPRGNRK